MLIERLKTEGYFPIVNILPTQEAYYYDDTPALNLELPYVIDFVNNIGGFIGVRSGLCDLLCSSDNPKKYNITPIEYIDWSNDLVPWFYEVRLTFDNIEWHINNIVKSLKGKTVEELERHQWCGSLMFPDFSPD